MIKKTTVLDERRIMRMRKEPDLRVGHGKPAHQIILQITLDRKSEGFFRQTAPRFPGNIIDIKPAAKLFFRNQGFQHAVPAMLGENARQVIKRSEEHTSELQSPDHLVCRLLLEKQKIR